MLTKRIYGEEQMFNPSYSLPKAQAGGVTLLVSVVLLLILSIATLVANRQGIKDILFSGNQLRIKQATANAQGILDCAFNEVSKTRDIPEKFATAKSSACDVNGHVLYVRPDLPLSGISCNQATDIEYLDKIAKTGYYDPNTYNNPLVIACGVSDDGSTRHIAMQEVAGSPPGVGMPGSAFTSPASVGTGGSWSVVNYFEKLTYWTGGAFGSGSATPKSITKKLGAPSINTTSFEPAGLKQSKELTVAVGCDLSKDDASENYFYDKCTLPASLTNHSYLTGGDEASYIAVIDNDISVKSLSQGDDFFRQFFGDTTMSEYKNNSVPPSNVIASSDLTTAKMNELKGQTIFAEGNLTLPGGTLGSITNPITLIVNGNLTLSSQSEFYGFIFVKGDLTGNGGPTVFGAISVAGADKLTGNPTVFYDPSVLKNIQRTGGLGWKMGTWRDFTLN